MTTVPGIRYSYPEEGTIMVHVEGAWAMGRELPGANEVCEHAAARPGTRRIVFDHAGLSDWDSSLLTFLIGLQQGCASTGLSIEFDGLPAGAVRLLRLASALTDLEMRPGPRVRAPFLNRLGLWSLSLYGSLTAVLAFSGEVMAAAVRMARGRARFRRTDLASLLYECGPQALPIVSLISVLVGIILAFVGVVQLRMFGAQIYIANLVGIAMVREMGALMTAIIMSGRTGASYATQLGTMEVNEEIDALKTLGIMPAEFLVLPRIIALVLMMPLLCVYADIVGILGGAETHEVCIRFSPGAAPWIAEQVWHPEQRAKRDPDGSLILSFPAADFREVKREVLKYGSLVEVISPEALRNEVKEEIERMISLYGQFPGDDTR